MSKNYKKNWQLGIKDFNTHYFDINQNHELTIKEGNYLYNVLDAVKKYNAPLEILFPNIIEKRLEELTDLFNAYIKIYRYPSKFYYHYPMKVCQNKEVVLPIVAEGANLETASANELKLVKKMWEHGRLARSFKVICNGPKTKEYLDTIAELKSKDLDIIPIIEDLNEYNYLRSYRGNVGIRLDVDIKVSSHWDRKIGRFGLSQAEIIKLGKIKNLKILHYHSGSQIELLKDILKPLRKAMETYSQLKKINPSLETLDIGGGMPIPYDRKYRYSIDTLIESIIKFLNNYCQKEGIRMPNIICEWGRYIVAPAQITVLQVIAKKKIAEGNKKSWYIINGSFMNDLLDTWALHQKWHVVPVNHLNMKKNVQAWLAGMTCDSDDKYTAGTYVSLPDIEQLPEGESLYLAFLDTGAYEDALSAHHCLLSSPIKLIAQNGEMQVIRKRESLDDVAKLFGW